MYYVIWNVQARAYVRSLPKADRENIGYALFRLQKDPSQGRVKKLKDTELLRLRVGDYRLIYYVDHGKIFINVVRVDHRKSVYKNL